MKIADGCFGMPIGRHTKPLNVTACEGGEGRAGEVGLSGKSAQAIAMRTRIVLICSGGRSAAQLLKDRISPGLRLANEM